MTRKERVAFFVALAGAAASFVVVMNIVYANATKAVPAPGGEYAEGVVGQPEYVNPVIASSEADLDLVKLVYSDVDDVADSITVSTDTRTWTVHLKSGLTWQDGEKLTSDDVVFTVQSIQDPDSHSPLAPSWQGVAVTRMSELEVQFTLVNPYAFFASNLRDLYIVPKHLFADTPVANWRLSDYDLKPVGSGPYRFASYAKDASGFISSYNLEAWDGNATQALIDRFDFNFFKNENDLVAAFNNGQVDGFAEASPADVTQIERPYDSFAWPTSAYYAVFFNLSKNLALQDPDVRAALSMAVNRDTLVHDALQGNGVPAFAPIPPGAPYFTAVAATTSLDLASSTLADDGWQIAGGSTTTVADASSSAGGAAAVPAGFRFKMVHGATIPLTVNLTVPQIDFLATTASELQAAWQSIGVQVNILPDAPSDIVNQSVKNRDYEALLFGNVLGPNSDLYSFWDSARRFYPGLNLAIYASKGVDTAIEDARQSVSTTVIAADMAAAQTRIASDTPAVFLYSPDYVYVTNRNVQGIAPSSTLFDPSDRFEEVPQWYLNTARILK
ncbi:MAG TPA: ABC transporter substrate-binding protein [Candidatus Paceibacterota bacterium]|nr:ABC transporter substrate-binding protein [Candidatus Paceibacterota bacterium]